MTCPGGPVDATRPRSAGLANAAAVGAEKALYFRHTAYFKMKDYDGALADLKSVIKLRPNEKKYRTEFEKIKEIKQKLNSKTASEM